MDKRGFTIVELVLALGLISFFFGTIFPYMHSRSERLRLEESRYDAAQDMKKNIFSKVAEAEANIFGLSTTSVEAVGAITRRVSDGRAIRSFATTSTYTLTTDVFDTAHSIGANTCNIQKSSQAYSVRGGYSLPTTFQAESVDILNDYAYVAGRSFDAQNIGADTYVFDISSSTKPVLTGSVRASSLGSSLKSVHSIGGYLFAAAANGRIPFLMVDTRGPSRPNRRYEYVSSTSTTISGYGLGNTITYYDGRVYLGLTKSTSTELLIFSFDRTEQNPIPQLLGGYETGTQINSIKLKDTTAYVATPDQKQVRILDVADPKHILEKGFITAPGYAVQDGKSLSIVGDILYVGRTVGGFDNQDNHEIFSYDIADPTHPILKGSINIGSSVNHMIVDHEKMVAFIGSPSSYIAIFDVLSNMVSWSGHEEVPTTNISTAIDCEDDTIVYIEMYNPRLTVLLRDSW